MTLIELFLVLAWIVCALLGATWAGSVLGWYGYVLGAVGGLLVFPAVCWMLAFLDDMLFFGRPRYPGCASGTCDRADYRCEVEGRDVYWVCGCGRRYQSRGRRFMAVDSQGALQPYMLWKPFRGWFPDRGGGD